MKSFVARVAFVTCASIAALGIAPSLSAQEDARPASGAGPTLIVVTGRADITIPADRAALGVAVETRAATAVAAGAENARTQQAVVAALREAGVAVEHITTAGYTVTPDYRMDPATRTPTPTGYIARNTVRVEFTKLDQVGRLIDLALGAGANRIEGIRFTAASTEQARRTALRNAIANARADAQAVAQAAGGTLGRLLEVSTSPAGQPPGFYDFETSARMTGTGPETSIDPRAIRVTAVVLTRWQLILGAP